MQRIKCLFGFHVPSGQYRLAFDRIDKEAHAIDYRNIEVCGVCGGDCKPLTAKQEQKRRVNRLANNEYERFPVSGDQTVYSRDSTNSSGENQE